jgi:hypothetical protein
MATHAILKYNVDAFWDDEFKHLNYINEPFNDIVANDRWIKQGYQPKFTGDLCDMRSPQPSWNQRIVDHFVALGWKDIGTSYYRMTSGTVLPTHGDLYLKYIQLFNLQGLEHTIRRAIIFLEDWKPGHYLEAMDIPYTGWKAGQVVEWTYDTPHLSANIGLEDRYTLQITGHVDG